MNLESQRARFEDFENKLLQAVQNVSVKSEKQKARYHYYEAVQYRYKWDCWRIKEFILGCVTDRCILSYLILNCSPEVSLVSKMRLLSVIPIYIFQFSLYKRRLLCMCFSGTFQTVIWAVIHWGSDFVGFVECSLLPVSCKKIQVGRVQTSMRSSWALRSRSSPVFSADMAETFPGFSHTNSVSSALSLFSLISAVSLGSELVFGSKQQAEISKIVAIDSVTAKEVLIFSVGWIFL